MKRTFALILILMLTALLVVPTFAIPVKSPTQSGKPDIKVVSGDFLDENGQAVDGCEAILTITPYQDKDKAINEVITESLELAYDSYKNEFGTSARDMLNAADPTGNWYTKYPGWDLRVVNIFDITLLCKKNVHNYENYYTLTQVHGNHKVSLKLSDTDASNFVALMHYYDADHDYNTTGDAHWELIPTTQQGNKIFFEVKCSNLSPFAIVVKSRTGGGSETGEPTSPQTGEVSNIGYWLSCGTFLAAVGVTTLYRMKKEKRYAR